MTELELFHGLKISSSKKEGEKASLETFDSEQVEETSDIHEALPILKSLRSALLKCSESIIDGLDKRNEKGGMSILTLKNLLMADYLNNMLNYVKLKLIPYTGKSLEGVSADDNVKERLCHLRIILERIRPIESKLQPLIDRYVKQANETKGFAFSGAESEVLKSSTRARPEDMMLDDDNPDAEEDNEEEDNGADNQGKASTSQMKKYRPPQLSATYYDPDWEQSATNRRDKTKSTAVNRLRMRELMSGAIDDMPDEIINEEEGFVAFTASEKRRRQAEDRHKKRYEEDNFVRLPTEKKKSRLPTVGTADRVLLYGRDGIDDDDLRVFASNDGSEMPIGISSQKKLKKHNKKLKRKQKQKKGKRAKRPRRK